MAAPRPHKVGRYGQINLTTTAPFFASNGTQLEQGYGTVLFRSPAPVLLLFRGTFRCPYGTVHKNRENCENAVTAMGRIGGFPVPRTKEA